jgi:hypothetical protein
VIFTKEIEESIFLFIVFSNNTCGDLDLKSCEILKSLQSKNKFDMKVEKKERINMVVVTRTL